MSLKKELRNLVGKQTVEIEIPSSDPGEDVIKDMDKWQSKAAALLHERNENAKRAEYLLAQCEVMRRTLEHRERDYERALADLRAEAEYWRKMSLELVHANADLGNTVNGMKHFIGMADNTLQHTEAMAKQLRIEKPQPQPEPVLAQFDKNGMPTGDFDPIDLDGVKQLSEQLAKVQ